MLALCVTMTAGYYRPEAGATVPMVAYIFTMADGATRTVMIATEGAEYRARATAGKVEEAVGMAGMIDAEMAGRTN